jgi:glutathione S-transferase
MRLRYSTTSPFARKVLIIAHELGLTGRFELERTNPRQDADALRAVNPLGKIPALVTDDGTVLYDSNVICEYLDTEFGGNVFPKASSKRWVALTTAALGDGIMEAGMLFRGELARDKAEQSRDAIEWQRARINTALSKLDEIIPTLDNALTIDVITGLCAIGYIDFRLPEHGFIERHKNIRPWVTEMSKRPSVAATAPRLS